MGQAKNIFQIRRTMINFNIAKANRVKQLYTDVNCIKIVKRRDKGFFDAN